MEQKETIPEYLERAEILLNDADVIEVTVPEELFITILLAGLSSGWIQMRITIQAFPEKQKTRDFIFNTLINEHQTRELAKAKEENNKPAWSAAVSTQGHGNNNNNNYYNNNNSKGKNQRQASKSSNPSLLGRYPSSSSSSNQPFSSNPSQPAKLQSGKFNFTCHFSDPEKFKDLADPSASLDSLAIGHGSIVFAKYSASRTVAGPPVPVVPAGSFGRHMTVSDMVARQMRIERQETSHCQQVSFDRDAANVFQHYVHDSLAFSIKRGGFLFGEVREDGHVLVDFIYEPPQHGTEHTLQVFHNEAEEKAVAAIAAGLGMRCVGFIVTQTLAEDQQAQEHAFTLSPLPCPP
ncbi:unnamed protein product [Closterium sp. NIES-53]